MAVKTRREQKELGALRKPASRYGRAKEGDTTDERGGEAATRGKPAPRTGASKKAAADAAREAARAVRRSAARSNEPEELTKPATQRRAKTATTKAPVKTPAAKKAAAKVAPDGKSVVRPAADVNQPTGTVRKVQGRVPAWVRELEAGGVAIVKDGNVTMIVVGVPSKVDSGKALKSVQATVGQLTALAEVTEAVQNAPVALPQNLMAAVAQQEADWRDLESRHPTLDGVQVGQLARSRAENKWEYASSLRRQGRVLAVQRGGQYAYPQFQFANNGRVRPVMLPLLAALSEWEPEDIALWMDSSNGYLGGATPIDRIDDEQAVLAAATNAAHAGE